MEQIQVSIHPQNLNLLSFQIHLTSAASIAESYELPAGDWIVQVSGSNTVTEKYFVRIQSGETQQLTLTARAGASVSLSVQSSKDLPPQSMRIRVFTVTEEQVAEQLAFFEGQSTKVGIRVPPADSYRVLVETLDGHVGEAWIDRSAQWLPLSGDAPRPAAVEILIR